MMIKSKNGLHVAIIVDTCVIHHWEDYGVISDYPSSDTIFDKIILFPNCKILKNINKNINVLWVFKIEIKFNENLFKLL